MGKNYVVEGFRNVEEIEVFRKIKDFLLIEVASGRNRRFEWFQKRNRPRDPKTINDITKVEISNLGLEEERFGQQNALCFALAEKFILNE
ncbi:hypothetical protein COU54_03010 [Candidatus Pacearchaeota archaeon CG10_big_fil_rev_8_21_14_0_10_31_24]|nr:MAG: hypothetical protein COU54_03010 [Candidatus Pacearchaeota archaeon CG10_big_fil_rev_8_21_14_0_10_31_24]